MAEDGGKAAGGGANGSGNGAASDRRWRNQIALWILVVSALAIIALGGLAIWLSGDKPNTAQNIFNMTLPVFASWVGTVLAFYFGRENFESANEKVRQLIDKLSPEERASAPISSIMRGAAETALVKLAADKDESKTTLKEMRALLVGSISRLPVVDAAGAPRYIVHGSSIDRYLADGGKDDQTLADLLKKLAPNGEFGPRKGFALARPEETIAAAKARMDAVAGCQDILITADGSEKQPLRGWVSNVRLGKFLQA